MKKHWLKNILFTCFSFVIVSNVYSASEDKVRLYDINFVEFKGRVGHESFFPAQGSPLLGSKELIIQTRIFGEPTKVTLYLLSADDTILNEVEMVPASDTNKVTFRALVDLPTVPFHYAMDAINKKGETINLSEPSIISPQTLEVGFEFEAMAFKPGEHRVKAYIKNHGESDDFNVEVISEQFTTTVNVGQVHLDKDEIKNVILTIDIPADVDNFKNFTVKLKASSMSESASYNYAQLKGVIDKDLIVYRKIDIKPGSCKNPLNTESKGTTTIVLPGNLDFDVEKIDFNTLLLSEDILPEKVSIEDILAYQSEDCSEAVADGYPDLVIKFKTQDIVDRILGATDGARLSLTLTASLPNEMIVARDAITVINTIK